MRYALILIASIALAAAQPSFAKVHHSSASKAPHKTHAPKTH